jgi:hypothetical protein
MCVITVPATIKQIYCNIDKKKTNYDIPSTTYIADELALQHIVGA